MWMYILWGAQPEVWAGRVQHYLMDMRTADMATGHMYVGGTVSEGLITLITMVRAFTRLGSLGMVLNSFHVFFNAPQKVSKVQTCTRIRRWVSLCFLSCAYWCSRKAPEIRSIFHTGDSSGPRPRTSGPTSRTELRSASICTTCGKTISPRTWELGRFLGNKKG